MLLPWRTSTMIVFEFYLKMGTKSVYCWQSSIAFKYSFVFKSCLAPVVWFLINNKVLDVGFSKLWQFDWLILFQSCMKWMPSICILDVVPYLAGCNSMSHIIVCYIPWLNLCILLIVLRFLLTFILVCHGFFFSVCKVATNHVAHVNCGHCRTTLMYPYGAPSVKCAVCHYVTNVGVSIWSILIVVKQSIASLLLCLVSVFLGSYCVSHWLRG